MRPLGTRCRACGAPTDAGATFCTWCGASLTERRPLGRLALIGIVAAVLAVAGAIAFFVLGGNEAAGDVVTYEAPFDGGSAPFTSPVDVSAAAVGAQIPPLPETQTPFGGTGSNTVCDREKLVQFLEANPDRLRAWTDVLGVAPAQAPAFIRTLQPATLAVDTRFTNHYFRGGRAVGYQSILPAGTAVLADEDGDVVVRCRCGNPLLPAQPVAEGVCRGCPRGYRLPGLLGAGEKPTIVFVINPPGVRGAFAGTFSLNTLGVEGEGCELASAGGSLVVEQAGTTLTLTASDLSGTGEVGAGGSFEIVVSGSGGRSGVLSGRFEGNRLVDGRLTAFGCTVRFEGSRN